MGGFLREGLSSTPRCGGAAAVYLLSYIEGRQPTELVRMALHRAMTRHESFI